MDSVRQLLEAGRTAEARDVVLGIKARTPELQNALGVCWLRLGETAKAIDLYRTMVLVDGGVCFRPNAPDNAVINYATALLLAGNMAGCEATLDANRQVNGSGAARLREAIANWKRSLGVFRRLMLVLGSGDPGARVPLEHPLGEI
jgi:hypothetical protein